MTPNPAHGHDLRTEIDLAWASWEEALTIHRLCKGHPPSPRFRNLEHIGAALEVLSGPHQSFFVLQNQTPPLTTRGKLRHVARDDILSPVRHFDVHDETLWTGVAVIAGLRHTHQTTQHTNSEPLLELCWEVQRTQTGSGNQA